MEEKRGSKRGVKSKVQKGRRTVGGGGGEERRRKKWEWDARGRAAAAV